MSSGRITIDMRSDINKMSEFLKSISEDRARYVRFTANPLEELATSGIDLSQYESPNRTKHSIATDLANSVDIVVKNSLSNLMSHGFVRDTSTHAFRETRFELNFDHSTSVQPMFEAHFDTTRGIFAEMERGTKSMMDRGFQGMAIEELETALVGPLINEKAMEMIISNVKATLQHATELIRLD